MSFETTLIIIAISCIIALVIGFFIGKILSSKKLAEEQLLNTSNSSNKNLNSDNLYQNLIDNALDGFFRTTVEGKFDYANEAMAKILGYSSVDELNKVDIVNDIYKSKEEREKLLKLLNSSDLIKNYRITLKRKDGSEVNVRINERVIKNKDGKPIFYEGSIQDITQQTKVEIARKSELDKLKNEKKAANYEASNAIYTSKVKGQFLAKMSHEIRTPMNSVLGFLTLIENGLFESEEELRDFAKSARISADSLLDIINNLLDISKIEAGKMDLNHEEFNIKTEIEKAVSITSTGAKEKGINVSFTVDENIPEKVYGDSTRYRQVVVNLLGNSVKYSKNGTIKVEAKLLKSTEATVKIETTVADTGKGIPESKIPELFKPYSQLKDKKWSKSEGAGLGLMICKEFVALMGGEISVTSKVDEGTSISFTTVISKTEDFLAKPKIEFANENKDAEESNITEPTEIKEEKTEKVSSTEGTNKSAGKQEVLKRIPELETPIPTEKSEEEKIRSKQIDEMLDSIDINDLIEDPDEIEKEEADKEEPQKSTASKVVDKNQPTKKRLLLVEDNPISQKVELKLLSEAGYAVDPVSNGFDAIEAVKTNTFDLVLMDVEMEDMTGLEATQKIRALDPPINTIPIIAVTAHSSMKDREKCLASGMDDYIAKPINIRFLKMTIDQWLKKERDNF